MLPDPTAALTVDPNVLTTAADGSPVKLVRSDADLVTIDEMAARLSVTTRWFRGFYMRNHVPHVFLGNKTIRFDPLEVVAHLKLQFGR